ncbi:hypothetical protein GCK72_005944 [Caenorhabditis remanei]|uniref:Uncharacterized protein n=1 Tax=Caenorhabditis remanei TaxID=31234 RepID=A0A6A5HDY5_CAERE|nr:hypothetical protein GCK72_005944 [Caenorhabditis remanei]KAF1765990.1 hypothetical protein GCK72_005944 [Caenorhabditis remanei]
MTPEKTTTSTTPINKEKDSEQLKKPQKVEKEIMEKPEKHEKPEKPEKRTKKDHHVPKKPERTVNKASPVLSEVIVDEKKKISSKSKTPKKGSIYVDEEKNEMRKTAKTQSVEEAQVEPAKPIVKTKESLAKRHRSTLKPGEINEKSDDTIEDAPSVRKKEGPSYEPVDGPVSPKVPPDVIGVKKLSKEKDEEAAK